MVANVRSRQLENSPRPIQSTYCFNSFACQATYKPMTRSISQHCTLSSIPIMLRSHLTVLESSAARYPSSPVFKIPQLDSQGSIECWEPITYQRFRGDVESYARYWTSVFKRDHIPQRSVIGIWYVNARIAAIRSRLIQIFRVSGFTYTDVLHIYGISRAGYIPQLFSLRLPNPEVIYELLHRANARALVHAQTFESVLHGSPVPIYSDVVDASASDDSRVMLPQFSSTQGNDIAFIFHTSGSTSGSPKLVPCSYRWLHSVVDKSNQVSVPRNPRRQDVTVMMFVNSCS